MAKKEEPLDIELPKMKEKKITPHVEIEEVKLKPIQLKVKKDNQKVVNNNTITKIFSTIEVVGVLVLLLASVFVLNNSLKGKKINVYNKIEDKELPISDISNITLYGNWLTENNSLFSFTEDNLFYWYDNFKDINDNYYGGSITKSVGKNALDEMGYTIEDFTITFGEEVSLDNVYSLKLLPKIAIMNGKDKSQEKLKESTTWWFIIIIKDNTHAIAYNKTLDIRYNLVKQ